MTVAASKFSVVMPVYQGADVIARGVGSMLAQTTSDWELVIVDDGSTDGSGDVARTAAAGDVRVRVLEQENRGRSAARNAGAAAATGTFVAFLDADDEARPAWLADLQRAARANDADLVHCGALRLPSDGGESRTLHAVKYGALFAHQYGPFLSGTFAITRARFDEVGRYAEDLAYGENHELGLRIAHAAAAGNWRTAAVDEPLVVHHWESNRSTYDQARYEAARVLLERHHDKLAARKGALSAQYAVLGVNAARIGRRGEAFRALSLAILHDPLRLRNYARLVRSMFERVPAPSVPRSDIPLPEARTPGAPGAVHGVLVTFDRPDSLARMLKQLVDAGIDSITVVDNAPSAESRAVVDEAGTQFPLQYVAMGENTGPAGGIAAGMARVLEHAAGDDWMLVLDDDRLTGTPGAIGRLHEFGTDLVERGLRVGAIGLTGAWFDARRGRLVRPDDAELVGTLDVDYIAGGQLFMARVAAAREIGVFDPALFFAFDDLDYCRRLTAAGYHLYAHGPEWRSARVSFDRLGDDVGRATRRINPWRRYYSVRNRIVIMRRYTGALGALRVTGAELVGRPVVDLVRRRPGWAKLFAAGLRAGRDAWTGQLGRRMEPRPEPAASSIQP